MRETIEKGISERQRIETVNGRKMSRIFKKKKKSSEDDAIKYLDFVSCDHLRSCVCTAGRTKQR